MTERKKRMAILEEKEEGEQRRKKECEEEEGKAAEEVDGENSSDLITCEDGGGKMEANRKETIMGRREAMRIKLFRYTERKW